MTASTGRDLATAADPSMRPVGALTDTDMARLMADGMTNEQIGNAVCLSKSAIKYHNKAIFRKLGVANRAEAVKVATQQALIQ